MNQKGITSMIQFLLPEKGSKSVCVTHMKDVDGLICGSLLRYTIDSDSILANYGNLNECLKSISDYYDQVFICDLGINKSTLDEFRRIREFARIIYIDHHQLESDLIEKLEKLNVILARDLRDCAGALTFDLLHRFLPREAGLLACFAAISDRLEDGPIALKLITQFDRDFVLFETMMLTYAIESAEISIKKKIIYHLSNLNPPHKMVEVSSLALSYADKIANLRRELPLVSSRINNVAYVKTKGVSSGTVANILLDVCNVAVAVCYNLNTEDDIVDLSVRSKKTSTINLGNETFKLAERFGGFGGGHLRASGARIPSANLMEFIHELSELVNTKP